MIEVKKTEQKEFNKADSVLLNKFPCLTLPGSFLFLRQGLTVMMAPMWFSHGWATAQEWVSCVSHSETWTFNLHDIVFKEKGLRKLLSQKTYWLPVLFVPHLF